MRSFNDLINKVYQGNSINFGECQNLSLGITKLIKRDMIEGTQFKSNFLKGFKNYRFNASILNILNIKTKLNSQIQSLESQGYKKIFSDSLKTQSRLIVGLGSGHVLETSITLHHIYGIPYIPASSLKGVCRMVSFWKIAKTKNILNNEKELERLQKEFYGELSSDKEILKYQLLFGAQNFKGLLLFLDAYPDLQDNQQIFDLDIMNVHYQSYYSDDSGNTSPGDWENPVPIVFLTVKEGIKFKFNVFFDAYRAKEILKMKEDSKKIILDEAKDLKEEIKDLLEKALKEFGVGAKTRLGYGLFE
ncbi:MAG: type III-B CRISPR module RAMP protein Cmr6 [bacterium]